MGFSRCVVPAGGLKRLQPPEGMTLEGVAGVAAAVELLF